MQLSFILDLLLLYYYLLIVLHTSLIVYGLDSGRSRSSSSNSSISSRRICVCPHVLTILD